jgi:hypothetical protein
MTRTQFFVHAAQDLQLAQIMASACGIARAQIDLWTLQFHATQGA